MTVIDVDFGGNKAEVSSAHKYAALRAILERRNEDFLRNPAKFFEMLGTEVRARESVLRQAVDVLNEVETIRAFDYDDFTLQRMQVWSVPKSEIDRLRRVEVILREWAKRFY